MGVDLVPAARQWDGSAARTGSATVIGAATNTPATLTISRGSSYTVLAGAPFTIQYQRPGSTVWQTFRTVTTNASTGGYSFTTSTSITGIWSFRAVFAGNGTCLGSQSPVVTKSVL